MILYNVTVNVEDEVLEDWLSWMKTEHIPEVMATGCFVEHKMLKLLTDDAEAQGGTFAVQYYVEDISLLDHYLQEHAPLLRQKHMERYLNKCVSFRTLLEEI